jgi:hypothetical protein
MWPDAVTQEPEERERWLFKQQDLLPMLVLQVNPELPGVSMICI